MRWLIVLIVACGGNKIEAAPKDDVSHTPTAKLSPIHPDALCVTKGAAAIGEVVTQPTMRAVARGASGDAAAMTFVFRGDTEGTTQLASGQSRRQLGLKLRAMNGCNLVYVMWRLDPKPKLDVSVKINPGMTTHKQCGADGYAKVRPAEATPVPSLEPGASHTLRAEIAGDQLRAWIDGQLAWHGTLPDAAHQLAGPAGIRSDNLAFDLVSFEAAPGAEAASHPKCVAEEGD